MVITIKTLEGILDHLDESIESLAKETCENLERTEKLENILHFLQGQFDIRLENILLAKKSSIHHLETGMKNKIIQRKQLLVEKIADQYKN